MNFLDFLNEEKLGAGFAPSLTTQKLSRDVGREVIIKNKNIYIDGVDDIAIEDYGSKDYEDIVLSLKDFISKNCNESFDILEMIEFMKTTSTRNKSADEFLSGRKRKYSGKSMICVMRGSPDDHGYIVAYDHDDMEKSARLCGLKKEGMTTVILDGQFIGAKCGVIDGATVYLIDPMYKIKISDGATDVKMSDGHISKIRHVRRVV